MEEILKIGEDKMEKRIKNLISIIILLVGIVIGSLFVDVFQLFKGEGFSQKNLSQTDVFEANGKTWAAFTDPIVNVKVVTDDSCEACNPNDVLVWSRRVLPTINAQKVPFDSEEGKKLISDNGIKFLPSFVFSEEVKKTDFYSQAQILFSEKNGQLIMNTQEIGIEPGKYIEAPSISEGDANFGNRDSKVRIVVFSDFQCPFCKSFYKSLRQAQKEFGDKIFSSIKHLPLDVHPKAQDAALASFCAQEQGKFWEYSDKLYSNQAEWANSKSNQIFKNYAGNLRLNQKQFNECLDSQKYAKQIEENKNEAVAFSIAGTPSVFINHEFKTGAVGYDEFKQAIEDELGK